MRLIVLLFYCYIVVFVFGQLTRFSLEPFEINLHLADIFVGLLVLTWLGWKILKKEKFIFPSLSKPILVFFGLAFLSLLLNSLLGEAFRAGEPRLLGRELLVAWLYLLRWIFYAGLYFVVYDLTRKTGNWKLETGNLLIVSGVASAVFGLIQYIFLPDTRFLESLGWDPHYYRLIGTFLDPGFLGLIFVFTLILLTQRIWSQPKLSWWIILWMAVYLALALTYSRASYLAYLVGMGTVAYLQRAPKFFLGIILVGAITVFLLPRPGGEGVRLERESTIRFRIINWGQTFQIAKDHLWFGVGFNAYRYSQRHYGFLDFANWRVSHSGGGADSSLLFTLATTGIFGFLAYLWLWGKIILNSWKKSEIVVLASVFALLVHSFFVNSLYYPWIMAWVWLLVGTREVRVQK